MTAPLRSTDSSEWITKEEAARRLDRSVRSVLAMAAKGKLTRKLEVDPETKQPTTRLLAQDIDHMVKERSKPIVRVQAEQALQPPAPQILRTTSAKAAEGVANLLTALTGFAQPAPMIADWLTVDEVAERMRVSRGDVISLVRCGRLKALRLSPAPSNEQKRAKIGSGWRIARRDYEELRGE